MAGALGTDSGLCLSPDMNHELCREQSSVL